MPKKIQQPEHKHQCATINWFHMQYPVFKECLFSIPNGAFLAGNPTQRKIQMNYMKKEGFKTGVSDLLLMITSSEYSGLFIEMKDQGKTFSSVSEDQSDHLELAELMGYKAVWAAGCDQAKQYITEYMYDVAPELALRAKNFMQAKRFRKATKGK